MTKIWNQYSKWLIQRQIYPSKRLENVAIEIYAHKENSFDLDNMLFIKPIVDNLKGKIIRDDNTRIIKEIVFRELFENVEYRENKMVIMIREMDYEER